MELKFLNGPILIKFGLVLVCAKKINYAKGMRFFGFRHLWDLFGSLLIFVRSFSTLEVYTDGSSKDGIGSWAYVISRRGRCLIEKSGRVRGANSNSMEFQAAIEALSAIAETSRVKLYSDSRILVDSMKWGRGPNAHQDQILHLLTLSQKRHVSWQWIKAHRGYRFNERCDELCTLARMAKF